MASKKKLRKQIRQLKERISYLEDLAQPTTYFVNAGADDGGNGLSVDSAFNTLKDAQDEINRRQNERIALMADKR